jgi:DNA-binding transcriptional MerR regulator
MTEHNKYIPVEEAAALLHLTPRMVNNYGKPPYSRIKTKRAGRRILYSKLDVLALAEQLGTSSQLPEPPKAQLVPIGEMLEYLNQTQKQLNQAMLEIGRLQGTLEHQRQLTQDTDELRQHLAEAETIQEAQQQELGVLRAELKHYHQPWWKRLIRNFRKF